MTDRDLVYWHEGLSCCNDRWENAYRKFETAKEEQGKFLKRFDRLGVSALDRELKVVDLFCGRGNGIHVLLDLGFKHVVGLDLSPDLLSSCPSSVERIVADCTNLKFEPSSVDVFIVQGGLHHLPVLPDDLEKCFVGMAEALRPGGKVFFVEPWLTPFLRMVHAVVQLRFIRRMFPKLDAFATMVEEEQSTYFAWLNMPERIERLARKYFKAELDEKSLGKWSFVGKKHHSDTVSKV